jgi:hypothetical protein
MAFVDGRSRLSRVTGRLAVTAGVLQWSPDRTSRRLGQAQSLRVPVADVTSAEAERVLGKPYARLRLQDGSQLLMDLRKASRLVEVLNGGADSDEGR